MSEEIKTEQKTEAVVDNKEQQAKETIGKKIGGTMLKYLEPINNNKGKIAAVASGVLASAIAFANWAYNDFSIVYLSKFIEVVQNLFTTTGM